MQEGEGSLGLFLERRTTITSGSESPSKRWGGDTASREMTMGDGTSRNAQLGTFKLIKNMELFKRDSQRDSSET